jgi:hypothetical protein
MHRPHPATTDDRVSPVGHVHHQNDPRLQPILGESEQFIQADHHAVDGLVAKSAMNLARRRILHELYGRRIQATQVPRQVKRFAPYPDIGTDTQGGFRLAHATSQRKQKHQVCKNAQKLSRVQVRVHLTH